MPDPALGWSSAGSGSGPIQFWSGLAGFTRDSQVVSLEITGPPPPIKKSVKRKIRFYVERLPAADKPSPAGWARRRLTRDSRVVQQSSTENNLIPCLSQTFPGFVSGLFLPGNREAGKLGNSLRRNGFSVLQISTKDSGHLSGLAISGNRNFQNSLRSANDEMEPFTESLGKTAGI